MDEARIAESEKIEEPGYCAGYERRKKILVEIEEKKVRVDAFIERYENPEEKKKQKSERNDARCGNENRSEKLEPRALHPYSENHRNRVR
jgi:hypothetical protein